MSLRCRFGLHDWSDVYRSPYMKLVVPRGALPPEFKPPEMSGVKKSQKCERCGRERDAARSEGV